MQIFGFNKSELIATTTILALVFLAIVLNLRVSLRRERDFQRKGDLQSIISALVEFQIVTASFPPSFEGKIVACFGGVDERGIPQAIPCEWHKDGLTNIFTGEVFLERLPTDPQHNQGARYYYISNGRYFQLYVALEGSDEAEYDASIVARNIMCGTRVCNYGRGFQETPLDKSIEEYENELRQEKKK